MAEDDVQPAMPPTVAAEPVPGSQQAITETHDALDTRPPDATPSLRSGSAPPSLPAAFGRYRIESLLGRGGMGSVYLAFDTQLDRKVALKIPKFGPNESDVRERFFREARAAAVLQHPTLCPVFDVGEWEGVHYLTMAFIDGKPLSHYVRPEKPFPMDQAAGLVRSLAKALQEAHDHGIIHRDLKPANVMIGKRRQPIIMDFGLARRSTSQDERLTRSGAIMGTPAYMPPEQVNGDVAAMGPCCDIYSLGVMLYELLTGRRPFNGPLGTLMAQILLDPPPSMTQFRPDIDPALEAICAKALAKKPADRYLSMKDFAAALELWLAGKAPSPIPESPGLARASAVLRVASRPKPRPVEEVEEEEEEEEDQKPLPPREPRKRRHKPWFLKTITIVLFLLVLMGGTVAYLVYEAVQAATDTYQGFKQMIDTAQAEQDRQRNAAIAEQKKWTDAVKNWKPPAADTPRTRLLPAAMGEYKLVESGDRGVSELNISEPGQRGLYRGPTGDVELFVYRANKLEKEAIVRRAMEVLNRSGTASDGFGGSSYGFNGSAEGPFLSYQLGSVKESAQAPAHRKAEQYGTFWGDRGWLFLVRSASADLPGEFLEQYLAHLSRGP